MTRTLHPILLAAALAFAGPATSQTQTETQPAPQSESQQQVPVDEVGQLNTGQPVTTDPAIGESYAGESFGDWVLRCVKTESATDPCQLYQLLRDQSGNSVAEIGVFPLPEGQQAVAPDGKKAVAGATIITPLETLLTEQLTLSVDGSPEKRYPFTFCSEIGCVARVGFLQSEIDAFKRGRSATLRIVPAAAPDQQVNLSVSLAGFTAGFDAVVKNQAAVLEAN